MVIVLSFKSKIAIFVSALAFLTIASMAAEQMSKYSVNLATNGTLGTYLVNQTGFTLYYNIKDASGNVTQSNCYGKCSEVWPPFYVENLTVAPGLNAADFTTQFRQDGRKQIAFKGWPLHFYFQDTKPKIAHGQAFNNVWFVVNPDTHPAKTISNVSR
jgi:predicted lipoprotein with Yx(FWY)xxD motif